MMAIEVLLCPLTLNPTQSAQAGALLDREEQARADRFLRAPARSAYVAARAALRIFLGEKLGREPESLKIQTGESGKPKLADDCLSFNISHSGDWMAIAMIEGDCRVGIDIEVKRSLDPSFAFHMLHASEQSFYLRKPKHSWLDSLMQIWTAKEAILKAAGCGLLIDPVSFAAPRAGDPLDSGPDLLHGLQWRALPLAQDFGIYGAIACDRRRVDMRLAALSRHPLAGAGARVPVPQPSAGNRATIF